MGVYIKGMEMPNNCMDCPFKGFDGAGRRGNICTIDESVTLHAVLNGVDVEFVRMGDCPLISVPQHGRLIDADLLEKVMSEGIAPSVKDGGFKHPFDIIRAVANAPTIIEREEET